MLQFLISVDQTLNTLWKIKGEGYGMADEMISARAFRAHLQGLISDVPMRVINALFFWQENHCYQAWLTELNRNQLPGHYRNTPCS